MSSKKFNNNPSLVYITAPEQLEESREPQTIKLIQKESPKQEPQTIKLIKEEKPDQAPQKKYMRLDITDCQEYISLMAAYTSKTTGKYTSMTQYIQRLIEEDKRKNKELYDKLEEIEKLKANII